MIKIVQKTIIECQTCGFKHTIIPLEMGKNYYELTDIRSKGVSVDIFFKGNQMKCNNCGDKDFSVFYETIEMHTPSQILKKKKVIK